MIAWINFALYDIDLLCLCMDSILLGFALDSLSMCQYDFLAMTLTRSRVLLHESQITLGGWIALIHTAKVTWLPSMARNQVVGGFLLKVVSGFYEIHVHAYNIVCKSLRSLNFIGIYINTCICILKHWVTSVTTHLGFNNQYSKMLIRKTGHVLYF